MCLPGDFPLDRVGMITKWPLQLRLNEKGKVIWPFRRIYCILRYPLVSKFMSCLTKNTYDIKKKTLKYWHQRTGQRMSNDQTKRPASGLKRKP